jgi:hypothetical protein
VLGFAGQAFAQSTTYTNETSNNTSTCPSSGTLPAGCTSAFHSLTDHWSQNADNHYAFPGPPDTPPASQIQTTTTVPVGANISKIHFNTLLYPGFTGQINTKVLCHAQVWWGDTAHISNGQNQGNAALVDRQVTDMISRGCDLVEFDWYGATDKFNEPAALLFRDNLDARCAQAPGQVCPMQMALMEDHNTRSGGTETGLTTDIQHIVNTYITNHPSYWRVNQGGCTNRGVILFFGWGSGWDWSGAKTYIHNTLGLNCTNEPVLIVEGEEGITPTNAQYKNLDGGYNWIGVDPYYSAGNVLASPTGDTDLSNGNPGSVTTVGVSGTGQFDPHFLGGSFGVDHFYATAANNASNNGRLIIGVAFAGFNDTNASWGFSAPDRHVNGRVKARQCGQVWINAWKRLTATGHYSSAQQVPVVGIPTWNDYEEGSAIEAGIENCATISDDPIAGNIYTFHVGFTDTKFGTEDTIDHYEIYYSTDGNVGENLNLLTTVPVDKTKNGAYQVTLSNTLPNPTLIYAKAVGVPSVQNHMTLKPGRQFTGGGGSGPVATFSTRNMNFPNTAINASSTAQLTVTNTGTGTLTIPQNGAVISVGANNFAVVGAPYPACSAGPGTSCAIQVSFTPTACQAYSGTLVISENADATAQDVSLTGTGINCPGGSTISPSTFSFGNVTIGNQSQPQTFTFTNNSGASVTPTITVPPQFILGNTSSCNALATGASCSITVTFAPTSQGADSGSLSVSNAGTALASATISGTGVSPSGVAVLYSAIQNTSGWTVCTTVSCAGGNGGATASWTPNQASPSEPDTLNSANTEPSAAFALGGTTAYSNAKFAITLNPTDTVSSFQFDMDILLTAPTVPQGLVFGVGQAVGGNYFPFQFFCDFKDTKLWSVWNPQTNGWDGTGVACIASQFPANTWVHLSFKVNTGGNQLHYTSLSVGGTNHNLSVASYQPIAGSPDAIKVFVLENGDSTQQAYTMHIDNMILYNAAPPAPAPNASLAPGILDLGLVNAGTSSNSRNLTVSNSGSGALSISSISTNNSQFSLTNNCGTSLASGASCNIGVTFTPTSFGTQTATITVSGGETITATVTGISLDPNNVVYSNIQNNSTWTTCVTTSCAGGSGGATASFAANQTSPTLNGNNSGVFSIGGSTAFSNARFKEVLSAQNAIAQWRLDADVYIVSPGTPQNIIFGFGQAISNTYYPFQVMCDLKDQKVWRIWNVTAGQWVATTIACTSDVFPANDWIHVSFVFQRTGGQMQYVSISVGADTYAINSALYNPTVESPDDVETLFFEGGDSSQDAYSVFLDNVTLSKP